MSYGLNSEFAHYTMAHFFGATKNPLAPDRAPFSRASIAVFYGFFGVFFAPFAILLQAGRSL
jgi:hypothetical protein